MVPVAEVKPHEILIKVGAVSLNFCDQAIADGIYEPDLVIKRLIPVSDAASTMGARVIYHLEEAVSSFHS